MNSRVLLKRTIALLCALALLFALCACGKHAGASPATDTDVSPTPAVTAALGAYLAVLRGDAAFYSTDAGKNLDISQLGQLESVFYSHGDFSATIQAAQFAVVDLDGDGTPEIVLQLEINGDPYSGYAVILRYLDGAVYGYGLTMWEWFWEVFAPWMWTKFNLY